MTQPDVQAVYALTSFALLAWAALYCTEGLSNIALLGERGFLPWRIVGLRSELRPVRRAIGRFAGPEMGVACYSVILVAAATAALFPRHWIGLGALALMLCAKLLINYRTYLGNDGSDQMATMLIVGLGLINIGLVINDNAVGFSGVLLIGGQATLAYFSAGAAKLISPVWRRGDALRGIMSTQTYGHTYAAEICLSRPLIGQLVSWTVIVVETAFPIFLLLPGSLFLTVLIGLAIFHLVNAYFMGLNSFVPTFIGTFPSLILLNSLAHDVVSRSLG